MPNEKIVIVDDDIMFTEMASASLENYGYKCVVANCGQSGIDSIAMLTPDIVLCDVQMPDLDGYTVCEWLRSSDSYKSIPFVMLTGNDDVKSIETAFLVGATQFIPKPVNWSLLPREVQYVLRSSKAFNDLTRSRERYALAAAATRDVLWDWDLRTNLLYLSARWQKMLALGHEEMDTDPELWLSRIHPEDSKRVRSEVADYILNGLGVFRSEHRIRTAANTYLWVLSHGSVIKDGSGKVIRFAGSMSDITESKRLELELLHAANHDELSGVGNRRFFMSALNELWSADKLDQPISLLYIDLDDFKSVNDRHGHDVGDQMIGLTANILTRCAPDGSVVSRLGGDEFTMLLDSTLDHNGVIEVAKLVSKSIEKELLSICDTRITASIGIAFRKSQDRSPHEFLQRADAAMYRSKNSGSGLLTIVDCGDNSQRESEDNVIFLPSEKEQPWKNSLTKSSRSSIGEKRPVHTND